MEFTLTFRRYEVRRCPCSTFASLGQAKAPSQLVKASQAVKPIGLEAGFHVLGKDFRSVDLASQAVI